MTGYPWPNPRDDDPDRLRRAWPTTVQALPCGARVTGTVIARKPFGVFIRIDGMPDALGYAESTAIAHDVVPPLGTTVTGEVTWHVSLTHEVQLRLLVALQGPDASISANDVPTAAARLVHLAHAFINFANGTFQWVDLQHFRLPETADDDGALLAALIAHERFGDNYAGGDPGGDPERHGPYWRERIRPACYDPIDADAAQRHLRAWAEQHAPLPEHLRPGLEREAYQRLRAADRVYKLRDLGPVAFHDWGGVHTEFHELVLIDRVNHTLSLLVAADD
ncbi:hypothetical protein [Salinispora fenicalii]|uniref:hypothetical protein n=1 Tax=Salinispora fenicalii TaxID=1137263 RepID=UPI000486F885|nr:hypothetical protein [Salinispora fenicalii]